MNNFLEISHLSRYQIESLLERAFSFKHLSHYPSYKNHTVAHLFYEHSTRTRISFEMAANHLAMSVINLDVRSSSESKGEIMEDTIRNLAAMGIRYFVIRHQLEEIFQFLVNSLGNVAQIVNAGEGTRAHPSQALLDIMTIMEQKPQLDNLKIAVVGDVKHSRVANSFQYICSKLGVKELVLISPTIWQPQNLHYGRVTNKLEEGLTDADVIICLRVQSERLLENEHLDLVSYRRDFALTQISLAYAKADAMIMHPGPMNRGIEIDSDVADSRQSFILHQVTNGIYARMAILDALISN